MGRKKKGENREKRKGDNSFQWEDILHSDAKRSIAAVFLFALAILFLLGFFGAAGVLGEWLDTMLGVLLGFGKWLLPLVLLAAAFMFLKRRTTTLADAVKFIGLVLGFCALLGLLHLYSGDTTKEMLKVARAGEGGGYVGFGFAYVLGNFTGKLAGTLIALSLFAVGMIAAFNMSLIHTFEKVVGRFKRPVVPETEPVSTNEPVVPQVAPLLSSPLAEEGEGEKKPVAVEAAPVTDLAEHNIGKIEFRGETVEENGGEEETVLVPAFIRPKHSRHRRQWELPSVDLLESTTGQAVGGDTERNKHIIQSTLKHFGIDVEPGEVRIGPTVTQYTFR
ncbi:MAG: DNA translocase FtsK 4TM domain-containing protein, partial [Candidatus Moranbacteria bacterium]|nr:DNA translocase FtsK 4TM domain-containing protein [Candidatus Moranbacteria bacterium]